MKKTVLLLLLLTWLIPAQAQIYFPPLSGNSWDTLSPSALNWCRPNIDSLYKYLEERHTDAFIVLKNGKIVLEKYFGTYTKDSVHYWASTGKSLTATLVGIALEKGLIHIDSPVSNYLGMGWTSSPADKEKQIHIKHLLNMSSGLDDKPAAPCDNEDTARGCLQYLAEPGTRWAYHTGAYRKLQNVVSLSSGQGYTAFTNANLGSKIGMQGLWLNGVYYSNARNMARFGLLALNRFIWNNDTLLRDTAYIRAALNSSQNFNLSYGYLWWLNGKNSYMAPGLQWVFTNPFMSNAPADMFCALGKNDQKIYVVPSQQLVVIRQGNSAYNTVAAFSDFDNEVWGYIKNLPCAPSGWQDVYAPDRIALYPNPSQGMLKIQSACSLKQVLITDLYGKEVLQVHCQGKEAGLNLQHLPKAVYLVHCYTENGTPLKPEKILLN